MEPELDRFWPRLNPVCENPRFQPPPALLKIEQLTFTSSVCPESMPSAEITAYKPTSKGTSSVLHGDDLKPKLCGLFPESA